MSISSTIKHESEQLIRPEFQMHLQKPSTKCILLLVSIVHDAFYCRNLMKPMTKQPLMLPLWVSNLWILCWYQTGHVHGKRDLKLCVLT